MLRVKFTDFIFASPNAVKMCSLHNISNASTHADTHYTNTRPITVFLLFQHPLQYKPELPAPLDPQAVVTWGELTPAQVTEVRWPRSSESEQMSRFFFTYKYWICFTPTKAAEPTECEYFSSPSRSVKHWWEWSIVTMAHCNVSVILSWCFYFTLLGERETRLQSSPALFSRCLMSELISTSGVSLGFMSRRIWSGHTESIFWRFSTWSLAVPFVWCDHLGRDKSMHLLCCS